MNDTCFAMLKADFKHWIPVSKIFWDLAFSAIRYKSSVEKVKTIHVYSVPTKTVFLSRWAVELLLVGHQTFQIMLKNVFEYTNVIKL